MQHHLQVDMLASVLGNVTLGRKYVEILTYDHLGRPTESWHVWIDFQIQHASMIVRVFFKRQLRCTSERVEDWLNSNWRLNDEERCAEQFRDLGHEHI